MPKLRRVSGQETVRALERLGFEKVRQRGSHVILKKENTGRDCWVCGTFASRTGNWYSRGILKQAKVMPDEFMEHL